MPGRRGGSTIPHFPAPQRQIHAGDAAVSAKPTFASSNAIVMLPSICSVAVIGRPALRVAESSAKVGGRNLDLGLEGAPGAITAVVRRLDQTTELQISAAFPCAIEGFLVGKTALERISACFRMRQGLQGGLARHFQVIRTDALIGERRARLDGRIAAICNTTSQGVAPR